MMVFPRWNDGLRSAITKIGIENDVEIILGEHIPKDTYDFLLFWGDSNCPFFKHIDSYKCKKGICLTTDPQNFDNLKKLDVVYCESDPVLEQVRRQGIRVIKAFGTNTEFFVPNPGNEKTLEYFYPATFSPWKRQMEIAYLGNLLLCVGTIQPDGLAEYQRCKDEGVQLEIGYFPATRIKDHYARSKRVIIPAVHGSERTVLEAMSMDILPQVLHPEINIKAQSYLDEFRISRLKSPRDFIMKYYSTEIYAHNLLKGML